ncbi:malto-oligosyltrehalose synthase [Salinicola sp. MH3R3-1]|uniref:malto-oligosyltrehalose synthase n=1 Tax=Salinicola sp. MH3R3-1 TaxID=1928762 RepID=UPI00094E312D|nr:malto-oligosyltrehalose synthase [Salinicola sp. MH3R3-1]OLO07261.1 malto-oligosyltrehalose synthase [Salinicola sp. MH3R3-1]
MRSIRATIRLQLHAGFTFDDARRQVDYYAALGVSHFYLSPFLASRTGSTHGYDGVDPTRVDPELGGEAGLARLVEALQAADMGILADIVPNHLAVGAENPWWQDVLAHGRDSDYARCFDIDWEQPGADGKLLLPFLGDRYLQVLNDGELTLAWDAALGAFFIGYHEHRFPLDPAHTAELLAALPDDARTARDRQESSDDDPAIAAILARHDAATAEGRGRLHALLERQAYRLAHWRTANDALNWRRFFDITELAGVSVEDESVFDLSHAYLLSLVERGWIEGLRIDHIDGLADPKGYALRLRARLEAIAERRGDSAGENLHPPIHLPIYVEKILGDGEHLHTDWGVDGTTGYEFLDLVSGVQHDPAGREPLTRLWRDISGRSGGVAGEVETARREMLDGPLTTEFERCVRAVGALASANPGTREFSLPAIRRVVGALAVGYPVYRSYADLEGRPELDAEAFDQALCAARSRLSSADAGWLERLDDWLGGSAPAAFEQPERDLRLTAMTRFQQLTSPLAAKAVEDTAGYRSAVLLSRNDVGCEGDHFAYTPHRLHAANQERLRRFPRGMLTTATHDHKRGEDVRARLAALSELTQIIVPKMHAWAHDRRLYDSDEIPSGGDRLMMLQLLLAAWPLGLESGPELEPGADLESEFVSRRRQALSAFADRLVAWQQKAMREAKLQSHWLAPDESYEQAGEDAIRRALTGDKLTRELAETAALLDLPGAINGLAQAVLRLCSPGVPDLYQGTEFWDQSLVDPDNRRPVDMAARREALDAAEMPVSAWRHWRDGGVKQAVVQRLLALRRQYPALFSEGEYVALPAVGAYADHVLAFARRTAGMTLVVVVPRLPMALLKTPDGTQLQWADTALPLDALELNGAGEPWLTPLPVHAAGALALHEHLSDFPCGAWLWT